ncbi:hypothetical protein AB0F72_08535 [Actinoplanes sp. NPDC023936]|uniref:hypothetical protein n=1 Tax=Actinoplanes sp. NPDC023936 TaxID=3154910 RepID=UPI0033D20AEB
MFLEDAHGNYIDKAAFDAAYNALVETGRVKLAQVRGDISERVVVALMKRRATDGHLALATSAVADSVTADVHQQISDWAVGITAADVADATWAAAAVLAGDETD